ncbi:TlpA disulfide reductase family protein [Rasiella sp. SM2506]|uniref:TlpA disulfide reductase family protein n=1 Tax=Rasiella sp. SM2506 TaxID=3423914 RepID=UPI003D7B191B
MKLLLSVLLAILLVSCGNNTEKDLLKADAVVKTITKATTHTTEGTENATYDELELMNFTEFEARYLQQPSSETTYVINFWATWCKPCIKELPYFEELNKNYKDKHVKVVLVSLDFPKQVEKQVIPFIKKHNLKSEIILLDDPDANTWIPKVSDMWSGAIPATLFVKGDKQKFFETSFTYTELETELKTIL